VPASHSLAAFVTERLGDLVAMILLSLLALRLVGDYTWLVALMALAVVVGLGVLTDRRVPAFVLGRVDEDRTVGRLLAGAARSIEASAEVLAPMPLLIGVALGMFAWAAEGMTFALVAHFMGSELGVTTAVGVFAIATLVGAISFLPGGVGPTEALMAGFLVAAGGTVPQATATMLLTRTVTLWWAVTIGAVAFLGLQTSPGVDP
jgi:uncharacterized membrane protein YbhN (UPF0104 family)